MQVIFSPGGEIPRRIASFGNSGNCTHLTSHVLHSSADDHEFIGYIADDPGAGINEYDGAPVFTLDELPADVGVLVPVLGIEGRRSIYERLAERGVPIIGSHGVLPNSHPHAKFGEGTIVTQQVFVGPGVTLGRGVIANNITIGHDTTVGDFSTLSTGAVIPGHVTIGRDVWVGVGASFTNGVAGAPLRIGDGAIIGVGAVVMRDVGPGETVIAPRSRAITWDRPVT